MMRLRFGPVRKLCKRAKVDQIKAEGPSRAPIAKNGHPVPLALGPIAFAIAVAVAVAIIRRCSTSAVAVLGGSNAM